MEFLFWLLEITQRVSLIRFQVVMSTGIMSLPSIIARGATESYNLDSLIAVSHLVSIECREYVWGRFGSDSSSKSCDRSGRIATPILDVFPLRRISGRVLLTVIYTYTLALRLCCLRPKLGVLRLCLGSLMMRASRGSIRAPGFRQTRDRGRGP